MSILIERVLLKAAEASSVTWFRAALLTRTIAWAAVPLAAACQSYKPSLSKRLLWKRCRSSSSRFRRESAMQSLLVDMFVVEEATPILVAVTRLTL